MRQDEQHGVERMDGRPSLLHAAARLLASDRDHGIRDARTVFRQVETAEAYRLRTGREAATASASDAGCTRRTSTPTAR